MSPHEHDPSDSLTAPLMPTNDIILTPDQTRPADTLAFYAALVCTLSDNTVSLLFHSPHTP
jgi:hypothetical protein